MNWLYFLFILLVGSNFWFNNGEGLIAEKINGGAIVNTINFKYMAAIMFKLEGFRAQNPCSGSLMSRWYISTVAHCFFNNSGLLRNAYYYVIIGSNNLRIKYPWTLHIQVKTVTIPTVYNPFAKNDYSAEGNLALVKLDKCVNFTEENPRYSLLSVRSINIKNPNAKYFVAGFGWPDVSIVLEEINGKTQYMQLGKPDYVLRYGKGKFLNDTECQDKIKDVIAPGNMCAELERGKSNKPVGICQADSGAPLVHNHIIDGIAIHGFLSCDDEEMPSVYLDTFYYRTLIRDIIADRRTKEMSVLELEQTPQGHFQFKVIT